MKPARMRSEAGKTPRPTAKTASLAKVSVTQNTFRFANQVFGLRQDFVLEFRVIGHPSIECADTADGSVETAEEFTRNSRRDLRSVAPRQTVFMGHHDSVG